MDEGIAVICAIVVFVFAGLGIMLLTAVSFDANVVHACKERGYWQTGQTRVICHVEEVKK